MRRLLICFCSLWCFAVTAQTKQPVTVTDMLKIKTVGAVTLSRDGSKAAFTVLSMEPDGDNKLDYKYVIQIWMVATDGGSAPRQLTTKENSSQPVFSPDGKQLAFVRTVDRKPQIFLLSLDGGEAVQLTHSKYGAGSPKWSPDGKQILFSVSIPFYDLLKDSTLQGGARSPAWPFEKPGFDNKTLFADTDAKPNPDGNLQEVRAYLENNVSDKKALVINKLDFHDEANVSAGMSFNHFFIINAQPGDTPQPITKGYYYVSSADFTPDGKAIIFSGEMDSLRHPDRSPENSLYIANRDGTHFRPLLSQKGKVYTSPVLSPSGEWLAFQVSDTASIKVPQLALMPFKGSAKDIIVIPHDRNKTNLVWSANEHYLYFTSPSNGGVPLYRAHIKSKKVEQLTGYESGITSFDIVKNKLAFAKTEVASPSELYLADADAKNVKRAGYFNSWVQNKQLSFPEKKSFTNNKGLTIEYWVMKPANYQAGKKYPLLLEIHGGPTAMWGPGESSMWHEYQFFCSKGYGVVYCNPRGSGGYGEAFMRANINDWGAGPASDVLTALDMAVAEGWADTSKLVLTGGSYAGYLVAWIIAHDQRFKAACSQRGVYDLATFFGEGRAWRLVPYYFGGYPWEPVVKNNLQRESPINYVQNITTPYIIFHGDNDRRTGFVQSEMLYRSLKVLGRPVEYVRHPNATHEVTRSGDNRQRIDQMLRTWEFFERYIR